MKLIIYGAKSIALVVYKTLSLLYSDYEIICFMVKSLENNPVVLDKLQVRELQEISGMLSEFQKREIHVLIGTPEVLHIEIEEDLKQQGFYNYTCIDSKKLAVLLKEYYEAKCIFPSLHNIKKGEKKANLCVIMSKFHKDKILKNKVVFPEWIHSLQVGADLTELRVAKYVDNIGENISSKNENYCELTGLYWLWKQLENSEKDKIIEKAEYYGLFHYRRILDINEEDLFRLIENDVDVILPYPLIHEPDMREHHTRYILEEDWETMIKILLNVYPEYKEILSEVFSQPYLCNYNIIVAKAEVLKNYCRWLFSILEKVEKYSNPKAWERSDRYIGYLGENLLTVYFFMHRKELKIYYTGCLMLT